MSPVELESILRSESAEGFTERILPLVAHEDKHLAKAVMALKRVAEEETAAIYRSLHVFSSENKDLQKATAFEARIQLAILAFCPWSEARKVPSYIVTWAGRMNFACLIFQLLRARKPDWLERWVNKEIESRARDQRWVDWKLLRLLIREGLCPKPQSENYTLGMLRGLFSYDRNQSLKEILLADPGLLTDEVWRIFELSPVRETILQVSDITYVPRGNYPCSSWSKTLVELSVEGKLDRQRLLSASLGSLQRNTDARNTGWFHKFHELLQPTTEERQGLQSTYLQLLSHPVSGVVGMALDALAVLQKAKILDLPGFLDAVGHVFYLQPKAQPLAAVKLLGRTAAHKEHLPKLAEALLSGLNHPAVEVQEAIIELLDKMRDEVADVIAATLPTQVECLAPSLQDRARKLFVDESAAPSATTSINSAPPGSEVIEQARQIPSPWREMAGIDSLLRAIDETGEISAVSFDPMAVPRLYPDQRVQPIATLDELIERLTVAIEGLDDAIEFELLIDGLSRLCDQRPEHFQSHVAPLLRRIEKLLPAHPLIPLTMRVGGLRFAMFKLVLNWCDRDVRQSREDSGAIFGFLDERLEIVAGRIRNRQAAPLLACPTHRQGWIDPREMASRLHAYQRIEQEPAKHDFVQGLLRLAPDGRLEAIAEAAALRGEYAKSFRYALGGPLEETTLPLAVLIAAGRARTPFADLTELQLLTDLGGPDALHPARYSWQVNHSGADSQTHWVKLYVNVKPDMPLAEKIRDLPATLIHTCSHAFDFAWDSQTVLNRWLATVWPANLDSHFSLGAKIRAGRHSQVTVLRQRATFLGPLFDPNVPFTEMAQLLLACCLNEQAPEVTGLAVDALVELIRDGRCIGTELGDVLGKMIPHGFIKLNRLTNHLETAARASPLHAHVCGQIVQTACAHLTEARKDLHHLFGPLLEWLSALEQGVSDGLRPMLEQLTSGKTGELARKLLALHGTPNKRPALLLEALQGRLQRAEKWANRL